MTIYVGLSWKTRENMGFREKWIKWIRFYTTNVRFLILINGFPSGFFPSKRDLRQGNLVSPFLFILAMEGLNDCSEQLKQKGG